MKILMVNKFLYLNGGSETYIQKVGNCLQSMGHEVEYFGMEDERNILTNRWGISVPNKEFRSGISIQKLTYPLEIIYSSRARKKIREVLDRFKPDVVHLNNINFQITPSIIYEIKKDNIPICWTAHDYQLVCPSHNFYVMHEKRVCTECLSGRYGSCLKNKCLHGSKLQSLLAVLESRLYKCLGTYSKIDKIICPSVFMKDKLITRKEFRDKCVVMYNFIDEVSQKESENGGYVLYFGRFDKEKGIDTLLSVCRELPDIQFVFAGSGEREIKSTENIKNVGFCRGEELEKLIRGALFSVYPSEWYENCPFSVIESQMYGVPVIGADMGGIPELIKDRETGLLFKSGDKNELKKAIEYLYNNPDLCYEYSKNCLNTRFDTADRYCERLVDLYNSLRSGDKQ